MEFFNKVKTRLKINTLIMSVLFLIMSFFFGAVVISLGFSSDIEWQIGVRGSGSGIPVSNRMLSFIIAIVAIAFFALFIANFRSFIKNTKYNKMIAEVEKIGDINEIGMMLASIEKSPYPKSGDLRYCEKILYYARGADVKVVSPLFIGNIQAEIVGSKWGEDHYVCVYYGVGVLKIAVSKKKVLDLRDDMRRSLMGANQ